MEQFGLIKSDYHFLYSIIWKSAVTGVTQSCYFNKNSAWTIKLQFCSSAGAQIFSFLQSGARKKKFENNVPVCSHIYCPTWDACEKLIIVTLLCVGKVKK